MLSAKKKLADCNEKCIYFINNGWRIVLLVVLWSFNTKFHGFKGSLFCFPYCKIIVVNNLCLSVGVIREHTHSRVTEHLKIFTPVILWILIAIILVWVCKKNQESRILCWLLNTECFSAGMKLCPSHVIVPQKEFSLSGENRPRF